MNKLSGEDIRKFENTLSSFNASLARQEEIVKKILKVEKEIGKVRLGALDEYFDAYSKGLDEIIARKTSQLNDAFLIMERKATESFKKAAKETEKATKATSQANKSAGTDGGEYGGGNSSSSSGSGNNSGKKSTEQYQTLDDSQRAGLEEANTAEQIVARLNAFTEKYKTVEEQTNAIIKKQQDAVISIEQIKDARRAKRKEQDDAYAEEEKKLEETLIALTTARLQEKRDKENLIRAEQMSQQQAAWSAELAMQNLINETQAKRAFAESPESQRLQEQKKQAEETQKSVQQLEEQRLKYIAKKEYELKRKNHRDLTAEEKAKIVKQADEEFKLNKKNLDTLTKIRKEAAERQAKVDAAKERAAERAALRSEFNTMRTAETFEERKQALHNLTHDEKGEVDIGKALSTAMLAVSDLAKQLNGKIDQIASYKGAIDTRLQGSNRETSAGSYWDQLVKDMTSVGAINPYFKQETFANNIKMLVEKGIAFDLEQRAFLMTIKDKIANTFDVADGTLLRLIRIQQEDSTAGRLGMESALNAFLNEMYETSEYLSDVANSVRSSLQEMESLMQGAEAAEVEYQVQKWLGSLYSVGMSDTAVTGISNTLGQIAAGQIEGLTGSGAGNLLIMAANDAGLSIADILTDGINASDTNKLLQAVVNYLAELADSAKDNKVVQQQLASVFGVKASDLKAATNLALPGTMNSIYGKSMSYDNMLYQLSAMAGSMGDRTSIAEMMTNFWENGSYTLAGSMASSPISYFIYKMASVVDDAAGGIDLPFINVMGFGVDLNTTVSDLMRVAAVGAGILGSIGPMIDGLGNSFNGQSMLRQLGIGSGSGLAITPRGDGGNLLAQTKGGGSQSTSGSGYIGNSSGSDIKDSTIQEAEDSKKQQMIEAKEEEEANQVNVLNNTVVKIYELLDDVVHGSGSIRVKVEGYGLTKAGSSGAQGGVGGALNLSSGGAYGSSRSGGSLSSSGTINSGGVSGNVDFGGWTTT